jgi:hypothetical protein
MCYSASINDIKPTSDSISLSLPLEVLSWDIEVSTETGKFDSNGYNPNNRLVCICFTVASAVTMEVSKR